ncbi:hypothetical protein IJ182_06770 [bacterium]|nr:hypothetical protein [bacterium]
MDFEVNNYNTFKTTEFKQNEKNNNNEVQLYNTEEDSDILGRNDFINALFEQPNEEEDFCEFFSKDKLVEIYDKVNNYSIENNDNNEDITEFLNNLE